MCPYCTTMCLMLSFLFRTLPILLCDSFRIACFVIVLLPGFVRFAWFYWLSSRRKSVRYGRESCRQTLDVYLLSDRGEMSQSCDRSGNSLEEGYVPDPTDLRGDYLRICNDMEAEICAPNSGAPVVVFFTGGAWLIGYKMWGALLARTLTAAGVLVVVPDYRNYPLATVPDMVSDVDLAVLWVVGNIGKFGGNPDKIVAVGQSAGGHLMCTSLLRRAVQSLSIPNLPSSHIHELIREEDEPMQPPWRPSDLKGFVSLSAPYDLQAMEHTFSRHGLDGHLVDRIFGGKPEAFDPCKMLKICQQNGQSLSCLLPPIQIYHGSVDKTVPHQGAEDFSNELKKVTNNHGAVTFCTYEGWSHTDPILEGPMEADHRFHRDLFETVREWTDSPHLTWPEDESIVKGRLCPGFLVKVGRCCNPF